MGVIAIMRFFQKHPALTVIGLSGLSGAIGFFIGILWCLHGYPDSPQAPVFGIFITGPAGFMLGLIASLVLVIRARRPPFKG